MSSSVNGDAVTISAGDGDETWPSAVTISGKDLTIVGPGATNLIIRDFAINLIDSGSRITGFRFELGASGQISITASQGFRYDHNTINATPWHICWNLVGNQGTRTTFGNEGLIDHNTIVDCRFTSYGEEGSGFGGSDRWLEANTIGTSHTVYLEDNTYSIGTCTQGGTGILCNFTDANYGGSYVARFNTVNNSYFEGHPTSGNIRGMRFAEVYGNNLTFTFPDGFCHVGLYYTGQLLFFNNTASQACSPTDEPNRIDINWHDGDNRGTMGACTGSNFVDSNELGNGWLCRDQPGASGDATYWKFADGAPAPAQTKAPYYIWNNPFPSGNVLIKSSDTARIASDRDFFLSASGIQVSSSSPFNGTTGTGWGTIARLPATCTTGVGYWATDEGEWNSTNGATPDGRLYRCTSTNTWTLYYTPYTYPHPLQGGAPPPPPTPGRPRLRFKIANLISLSGAFLALAWITRGAHASRFRRTQ